MAPARVSSLETAAPVFAALGEPTRLLVVSRLCRDGPQSIVRLTDGTGLSRQAVTKHLRSLERAGVLDSERRGRMRLWSIRRQRLEEVKRYLDQISEQWDQALDRLQLHLESDGE